VQSSRETLTLTLDAQKKVGIVHYSRKKSDCQTTSDSSIVEEVHWSLLLISQSGAFVEARAPTGDTVKGKGVSCLNNSRREFFYSGNLASRHSSGMKNPITTSPNNKGTRTAALFQAYSVPPLCFGQSELQKEDSIFTPIWVVYLPRQRYQE
jgi:hypothetical protein